VVLDWHRPRQGGSHLLSAIRERHDHAVPILVLSTLAGIEMARHAGSDAFLRKPYFVNDLVRMI
jgi:DNA-binding response OmpR family regulator